MAFRIGHQITCNLKKNPIFRSLSVDSSHDNKYQSCTAVNRSLNTAASTIIKGRKLHVSRTRSLPPPENSFASPNRWFSLKNFEDPKSDDPQYVTEYIEQRPSTSGRSSVPSEFEEVVLEDKASHQELQPSNAKPVTDSCIRNDITFLTKATRNRLNKIGELKRSAHVQYEKALKAFVAHEEDDCCRYQLEAARRKVDQPNDFYNKFKRQYETEVEKAHQLQPKNIKPYGKLNTLPWAGPNSEFCKVSITDQDRRRSRYETVFEKRRRIAASENKSPADPGGQQREYCTTNASSHANTSPDLEKCKAIIAEYKKLNPDYTGKTNNVIPGSDEEKLLIEKTRELISRIKGAEYNNESSNIVETSEKGNNVVSSIIAKKAEPENFQETLVSAIGKRPKLSTSQPVNQKVVLYYQNKYKNKRLCSKVIQCDSSVDSSTQQLPDNTATDIEVKIGPKLMLQSFDLNDQVYNAQDLVPARNVKFVAPWLSWSDRVKQHIQKKSENTVSVRSNSVSERTTQKDGTLIAKEIQKRQFSQTSNIGRYNNTFTFPEPQVLNDNASILAKNMENIPSFSASLGRLYSTNSTRGVLGPEGTVMVKLRRLPKINIPEPIKDCSAFLPQPCEKSDGVIEVKQKKLPKLSLPACGVKSMRNAAFAPIHLERPKSRGVPPEPPRICPSKSLECMEPRADNGMVIHEKKLPKIEVYDCPPIEDRPMTSPPLPRLKPRPLPPTIRCADIKEAKCYPRADEGLRVTKKKLPDIGMSECCPESPTTMTAGEPLKRLKKLHVPEPEKVCLNIEAICPPRADEVFGYKVKRKKLQTLLLGERYNNLSWKEFNAAKENSQQTRNYTTDSKYSMCCYSDKSVHPNFSTEDNVANGWDKFNGQLFCEENGKLITYLPPEEKIDDSMGSELKIVKKPIGAPYMKDNRIHEELLKGGFTTFINKSDRKFSSFKEACTPEPDTPQYTDWRLKPLKKRTDFKKDFPSRARFQKNARLREYRHPCEGQTRMDDILKYEVKPKKLPVIPKGKCEKVETPIYKPIRRLSSRPKKKYLDSSYDCPKQECVDPCPPRADEGLIETYNKLIPMSKMSNIPEPIKPQMSDSDDQKVKRLPPAPFEERPPCESCDFCEEREIQQREEEEMELRRRAHGVDPNPKILPRLASTNCPRKPPRKMKSVRMRRLPKAPFMDREIVVKEKYICNSTAERADCRSLYQKKPKKLKTILTANNKAFSTLPTNYLYNKNFSQNSFRCISRTALLLQTSDAKCKKIGKKAVNKCPKITGPNSKCKAKSISCAGKQKKSGPCTKQRSPYPSFSEYKEHYRAETISECTESERHLQPRWPILGEIINQKPPPPHQGKIDPTKQEECIAKRLNMEMEGGTKTCETMGEPDKPLLTNEMYKEVINNPPYDKCECANEKTEKPQSKEDPKGPCPRIEQPICPDPEIECELPQARPESMACAGEAKSPKGKTTEKPKLICKKKEKGGKVDKEKDQGKVFDECDELEKKLAISEKKSQVRSRDKLPEEKMEKPQECQDQPKECKPKENECLSKKQQNEDGKSEKKKECGEGRSQKPAHRSGAEKEKKKGKKEKKSHCRNIKVCGKGKGTKGSKKDLKRSGKKDCKKGGKKGKPKKCSDILKEEDAKEAKKKSKTKKAMPKAPQMADLCKQKKPCTPKTSKPPPKATSHTAVLLAKCPPKRSFWQRIIDFFRARPNCPPPDQWKKDKLRKRAEKAAAAAGLELCEKKKPKVVKVTCKKTGVRDSKLDKRIKTRAGKDKCKKIKVSCGTEKKTIKKKAEKETKQQKRTEVGECRDIKPDCKKSSTKSAAKRSCSNKKSKKVKPKAEVKSGAKGCAKVAEVVKAKECDPEAEKNCVDEKETCKPSKDQEKQPASTGKCKVLPKQKFCKPRARMNCKNPIVNTECTPVESPYPSFSEVKKHFPRLPSSECTEQEKNIKRKTITYDYNEPGKERRKYSTTTQQKRFYSSNSNGHKKFDPLALLSMPEESLNEIEDNELALRILEIVKEGMKTTAIQNSNITKQKYYDIFKELEFLCEQELSRSMSDDSIFGLNSTKSKFNNLLPDTNLSYSRSLVSQTNFTNIEESMMKDAIRNFCQTIFSMPNLSTMEYEDTEKMKTEKLQKQLDEILDNYKTK